MTKYGLCNGPYANYYDYLFVYKFSFYDGIHMEAMHKLSSAFWSSGTNTKKPSAPDMFTESDDMFAADFDVSVGDRGGKKKKRLTTAYHFCRAGDWWTLNNEHGSQTLLFVLLFP